MRARHTHTHRDKSTRDNSKDEFLEVQFQADICCRHPSGSRGTTLTQILDEDDVLQECKAQNRKLINFFIQPHIMEELVRMVCEEPPEDKDWRSRFKYCHLACEILTSETKDSFPILEELCNGDRYQLMLWAFLDQKTPLNPLSGSFISKVLSVLLAHKCSYVAHFVRSKDNFLPSFLSHLNTSAFSDLLLQMFAAPDTDQARLDLALWLRDNSVVEMLIDKIHIGQDDDLCVNVAQLLGDIVRIGREWHQMALPSPIIARLEETEAVERLLRNMLDTPEHSDMVIVSGISVLLNLMETRRPPNPFEPQTPMEDYTAGLKCAMGPLCERVSELGKLLQRPPRAGVQMLNTTGTLDPPFGSTRLQVLKLFVAMMSARALELSAKVVQHDVFNTVLDLFFSFPWNNFLHTQVDQCLHVMLDFEPHQALQPVPGDHTPHSVSANQQMHEYLFGQCRLLERLLDGYSNNENIIASGGRRQGYMGHLTHMVNSIRKWYESSPAVKELVQSKTGEEVWCRWCEFLVGPMVESNRRNEITLGGEANTSSFDDSEDDFESPAMGSGNVLEKEFAEYRNVLLATPIEDDFGSDILDTHEEPLTSLFNRPTTIILETLADENKSELQVQYEEACTARIQQFDESHSDEEEEESGGLDPWTDSHLGMNSTLDRNSSGIAFSSSGEEEDCDSPFDGLHTQHALKISHSDEYEDDPEGVEPQGPAHHTSPTSLSDRAAAYVSGSLGADSTTHPDLSSAGLERDAYLHWREGLQMGDSDSESDDDSRAIVGLNADWTKEMDAEQQHEEPPPTESIIEEVELVSSAKDGGGSVSLHEGEAQDVDLAGSLVKVLLNDSSDYSGEEEDSAVLPQQTQVAPASSISEGNNDEDKENQEPTASVLGAKEENVEQEVLEISPSSSASNQSATQEADSMPSSSQDVSAGNHQQEVSSLPSELQEEVSSSSEAQEVTSLANKLQEVLSLSNDCEVQEVTISLDSSPHLANDACQPKESHDGHTHISNDRGVPAGETGAPSLAHDAHKTGTSVDTDEVAAISKSTESASETRVMNGPATLDIGGGVTLAFDEAVDMELEDLDNLDDNFSFLAGKGMLGGSATVGVEEENQLAQSPEEQERMERVRQEAQRVCYQYGFETKANTK